VHWTAGHVSWFGVDKSYCLYTTEGQGQRFNIEQISAPFPPCFQHLEYLFFRPVQNVTVWVGRVLKTLAEDQVKIAGLRACILPSSLPTATFHTRTRTRTYLQNYPHRTPRPALHAHHTPPHTAPTRPPTHATCGAHHAPHRTHNAPLPLAGVVVGHLHASLPCKTRRGTAAPTLANLPLFADMVTHPGYSLRSLRGDTTPTAPTATTTTLPAARNGGRLDVTARPPPAYLRLPRLPYHLCTRFAAVLPWRARYAGFQLVCWTDTTTATFTDLVTPTQPTIHHTSVCRWVNSHPLSDLSSFSLPSCTVPHGTDYHLDGLPFS